MPVSINELKKASNSLEAALAEEHTDIVRDASIQRFEFCVELAWKILKKIMGTSSVAPKSIIREAAQQGLIEDPVKWIRYLDARNLTSHTYNEETAQKVFKKVIEFHPDLVVLIQRIEEYK